MLEGLAVWCLFIYLLRLVGMPWNTGTKTFAYLGGTSWLLFVWVGLINYTPMDLSGGSVVQAPHIQLRPTSTNVAGKVEDIYITPNQRIEKGQLVYTIEDEPYQISYEQAKITQNSAAVAVSTAKEEVKIAESSYESALHDVEMTQSELEAAKSNKDLQQRTLKRYLEQNKVVRDTITESMIDNQQTIADSAVYTAAKLESQLGKKKSDLDKAKLEIMKAKLAVEARQSDLNETQQKLNKAKWDLDGTKIYAPADGFVTNFILREGQLVSRVPRLQMYTNEKYVLMRVNHQAIRNVKPGQLAEFSTPVYPGKVFSAQVEGIVEATGEAQGNLLGFDDNVRTTTGKNLMNKHHFVRLKVFEPQGYSIPVGSVGLAWISGEKPTALLGFLDAIRGIIIRMKAQLYYFYSI
ncbi:HlyD family secretion protein [Vibrio crassostreae]|uniref:HlyD family secretion protein n=1 Tax=Vibrio crassostreae TaxID=246167 RepID=UPI001B305FCB|nr:efflux RND transporter periplasmic adaptor subunit [Vibrio crassostreae]